MVTSPCNGAGPSTTNFSILCSHSAASAGRTSTIKHTHSSEDEHPARCGPNYSFAPESNGAKHILFSLFKIININQMKNPFPWFSAPCFHYYTTVPPDLKEENPIV
ncbi:hypothetical protein D7Y09_09650 [bacterium 1XD42-1]|nr:hypothetical protein D7X25_09090 [bacterium 1XD42-8]RKJ64119.1 hypothetical protein D7Y09_09650 [bacterium 1XD42-1]